MKITLSILFTGILFCSCNEPPKETDSDQQKNEKVLPEVQKQAIDSLKTLNYKGNGIR